MADCDHRRFFWTKLVRTTVILGFIALALCAVLYTTGVLPDLRLSPNVHENKWDATAVRSKIRANLSGSSSIEIDNPASDGWPTELFSGLAKKQLDKLAALMAAGYAPTAETLSPLVTGDFVCGPLLPVRLQTVFQDNEFHIQRNLENNAFEDGAAASGDKATSHKEYFNSEGFSEALRALLEPFSDGTDIHCKLKIFRVEVATDSISTEQYFSCSGKTKDGMVEQHATWRINWTKDADGIIPRIKSIQVEDFEMSDVQHRMGPVFVDCTDSILGGTDSYSQQLSWGMNHWLQRTQERRHLLGSPGVAIGDVNGDGLEDLYLCQELGLPNLLFLQNPDGTLDDVSAAWGIDWLQHSRSALLVDLDNDKDQDLVVGFFGGVLIASNESNKRFKVRTVLETSEDVMSLSASDFDEDGDLDIYVSAYFHSPNEVDGNQRAGNMTGASGNLVFHDANTGASNSLLRNEIVDDDWTFTDVTEETGLIANNSRYSYAAAWEDYDNDGDQDLYVANDFGRDNLYQNTAGHFTDVGKEVGAEDAAAGMAVTWGDFNRDGWMDAYISNMWSSAGNRITHQPQFKTNASPELKTRFQRLARGNTLLANQQDGSFRDVSAQSEVEIGRWAWSSKFLDWNNDGWEDLVVANGYVTNTDKSDL